jgi:ABC-type sugar transport system substrate-binding protein
MNKRILLGLFVLLAVVLVACATPEPQTIVETVVVTEVVEVEGEQVVVTEVVEVEVPVDEGPVTIGYAAPSLVGGQVDIQGYMLDAAREKGWQVVTTNADGDPQAQVDDVDYLVSLGVDAIVAVPQDSAGFCAAVDAANAADIPVYTIDRSPAGCQINMTVLSDNFLAGEQAGEAMVDALVERYGEPMGLVLEITGDLGQNVGQLRRDGFNSVMDQYENIEVIQRVGDWQADRGQEIVRDVLTSLDAEGRTLDGIYMHSDAVYIAGTLAVLEETGNLFQRGEEGHVILTAVDGHPSGVQAIRDGWQDESSNQPINYFGIIADWIERELNGETIEEDVVVQEGALWSPAKIVRNADGTLELFLATTPVTIENVDNPDFWANLE